MPDTRALAPPTPYSSLRVPVRLTEPDAAALLAFEDEHRGRRFNHEHVAASMGQMPPRSSHGVASRVVGADEQAFDRVARAIGRWAVFEQPWLRLAPFRQPVAAGHAVTFASRQIGLWMLHPCRVVAVVDEREGEGWTSGIAYGTLQGHMLSGEERIAVHWDRSRGEVTAEIRSFASPGHLLSPWVQPVIRASQERFRRGALDLLERFAGG
ncbi:MAG: DUF1990 domain-containing protein [Myxococcales bacterium]|nr:DUF1990 domain-containing protein [Myxococcales bacterium]